MPTKSYVYGLGRRKAATARARLYKGKGTITINGKDALEYFSGNKSMLAEVTDPLALAQKQKDYDVSIRVSGGGLAGQVDAIKLAISKALVLEAQESRLRQARPARKRAQEIRSSLRSSPRTVLQALSPQRADAAPPYPPYGGFFD